MENKFVTKSLKIKSLKHLSLRLGLSESYLERVLEGVDFSYTHRFIDKKPTGKRVISVPSQKSLILTQKKVFRLLEGIEQSPYAYGSVRGGSVDYCLTPHINKRYLYCADIKSFFRNIKHTQVYKVFLDKLLCSPDVSRVLTFLSTTNFSVPQGVSTSSAVANLVLKDFDFTIADFCKSHGATYSRYVDNLIISSNRPVRKVKAFLKGEVYKLGFRLKNNKVALFRSNDNFTILGRILKSKIGIPRSYRSNLRATLHNCVVNQPASENLKGKKDFRKSLESKIKLIKAFYPSEAERLFKIYLQINWDKT